MPNMAALSHCAASPKYSLKGRHPDFRKSDTPGPGNYSGNLEVSKYNSSPKFGFGSASRDPPRPATAPGPGAYSPASLKQQLTSSQGFGGAGRKLSSPNAAESPGPGSYQLSPRIGNEGPKYSQGTRRELPGGNNSPGPAAYNPATDPGAHKMGRMPQHSFAKSSRNGLRNALVPGPGQYTPGSINRAKSQEYSFGHSGRRDHKTGIDPGPGSYNLGDRIGKEGPAYSAGSRSPRQVQGPATLTPGPGTYNGDLGAAKYQAAPKFGFGSSSRDMLDRKLAPGPGQYSPPIVQKTSPRPSFGTSSRSASASPRLNAPGPGSYTLTPRLGNEGPKYSAGSKRENFRPNVNPGPGSYAVADGNSTSAPSSPRFGFGSSTRQSPRLSNVPGPGQYNEKQMGKGPNYSFGAKHNIGTDNRTPGPGAHDHTSLFT